MRIFLRRLSAALLAALLVFAPLYASAVTADNSGQAAPTKSMTRSERSLRSILAEKSASVRSTLFTEFVNSRLKYVTVRSLSKTVGSKWLGYVDIVQELDNEKHVAYLLDQGVVQYGYACLPAGTVSATLKIGSKSETLRYDGEPLFSFSNLALSDSADEDPISLRVAYYDDTYEIDLVEHYPNDSLKKDEALAAMASAYAQYAAKADELQLVDHAVLKLKSYVSNFESQKRSFIWELYLVHGDELPAQTTLIRYYPSSQTTRAYARTLRSYF